MLMFIPPLDWLVAKLVDLADKLLGLFEHALGLLSFGRLMNFDSPFSVVLVVIGVVVFILLCVVLDFFVQRHTKDAEPPAPPTPEKRPVPAKPKETNPQPPRLPDFMMRRLKEDTLPTAAPARVGGDMPTPHAVDNTPASIANDTHMNNGTSAHIADDSPACDVAKDIPAPADATPAPAPAPADSTIHVPAKPAIAATGTAPSSPPAKLPSGFRRKLAVGGARAWYDFRSFSERGWRATKRTAFRAGRATRSGFQKLHGAVSRQNPRDDK